MKFRIVEHVYGTSCLKQEDKQADIEWIIEKKTFWGWREIMHKELVSERVPHKTYADAEAYMITNYMLGDGWFRRDANVYTYTRYTTHLYF